MNQYNPSGWEAVGYGIAGGFERDLDERKKIQALDAAKQSLQYDEASGQYKPMQGSDLDLLRQQNEMLIQQLQNVQTQTTTEKQWQAIVDGVETSSYDSFNKQINTNPLLQKVFKQDLGITAIRNLNAFDNDRQLNAYATSGMNPGVLDYLKRQRDALLNGQQADMSMEDYKQAIKDIGTAYPIVENADGSITATSLEQFLASTNLAKNSVRLVEQKLVFDTLARGKQALQGITDAAYRASIQSAQAKAGTEASDATKKILSNEIMVKAMNTGDPQEVMKALQLTDPEAFLKMTRGDSSKRDALQQFSDALDLAGIPKDQRGSLYQDYVQKTLEGVSAVAKESDVSQLTSDRTTARSLYSPDASKLSNEQWFSQARITQDKILSNMDDKEKSMAMKAAESLEANYGAIAGINRILSGKIDRVDKDAIQSAIDWVRLKTGSENAQTLENVDFNTQAGMLLANYIKAMSGTAASDAEVQRLMGSFLAGNFTDERYIKRSMQSFMTFLQNSNNTTASKYRDTLPYTVGKTTNLKPKSARVLDVKDLGPLPAMPSSKLNLDNFNLKKQTQRPQQSGKVDLSKFGTGAAR